MQPHHFIGIVITLGGILENNPRSITRRLSTLSANKQVYDSACPPYQEALKKSGYEFQLKYEVEGGAKIDLEK